MTPSRAHNRIEVWGVVLFILSFCCDLTQSSRSKPFVYEAVGDAHFPLRPCGVGIKFVVRARILTSALESRYSPKSGICGASRAGRQRKKGSGLFVAVTRHRFKPVAHVEFFADVFHVGLYGFRTDSQLIRDFLIHQAGGQQIENLALPRSEAFGVLP